jgi:hypothetical protein
MGKIDKVYDEPLRHKVESYDFNGGAKGTSRDRPVSRFYLVFNAMTNSPFIMFIRYNC